MGSEERQSLEKKVEEEEEMVEGCVRTQKDMFLIICQRMITVLTDHLTTCDQEGVDYETTWFLSTLDNFRQLLVKVSCVAGKLCHSGNSGLTWSPTEGLHEGAGEASGG